MQIWRNIMEDSHIKRIPYEFWTDYLVRRLGLEGIQTPIEISTDSDGDSEISWIWLNKEIKTNKGEVSFNRMLDFNRDVFEANRKDLEKLSFSGYNEYFVINERDKGEGLAYRQFGFMIDDRNKVEITDHSSEWRVPNFPGRNSWADFPLIEKYKKRNTGNPKTLVDDVVKYIKTIGILSKEPKKIEQPRRAYSQGPSLGLSLSQRQINEFPNRDEETKLNKYGEIEED
jgi:hypothetical protein